MSSGRAPEFWAMMIEVRFVDGRVSKVHPQLLQDLIMSKRIRAFMRADGWVDVERDPIRRKRPLVPTGD